LHRLRRIVQRDRARRVVDAAAGFMTWNRAVGAQAEAEELDALAVEAEPQRKSFARHAGVDRRSI